MSESFRFMSEVFRIIKGALRLDIDRVRNYTAFLATKLHESGDEETAARLRRLLLDEDHQLRPAGVSSARTLPVDSESRFPLIERIKPQAIDEPPVVLDDTQWATVREFISVAKSQGQIEADGVAATVSLLVYGPPGTGKSRLARFVAAELGLDLYITRLDGLISSFLGNTSKNIRALFEFASKRPCVLFLDEFDAVAKLRGDIHELGELKRVVNSFIQNLDSLGHQSIVLAATNHDELLDSAVWRRFAYRLKLVHPDSTLRRKLWEQFLPSVPKRKKDLLVLVDLSDGFSGADIREVCLRLERKQIVEKYVATLADAFTALRNIGIGEGEARRATISGLHGMSPRQIARALRERDERLYSAEILGRLLGVSKATAYRWTVTRVVTNG